MRKSKRFLLIVFVLTVALAAIAQAVPRTVLLEYETATT